MNGNLMKYKLVRACISDLDDIISFEKSVLNDSSEYSSRRSLYNYIKSLNSNFLLIKSSNKICGYGLAVLRHFKNKPSARILKIAVKSGHRRKGLAVQLLEELEQFAVNNSMTGIFAEVRESNHPSLRLFQKIGYQKTKTLFDYYSCLDNSYELENGIKLYKHLVAKRQSLLARD